MIALFLLAAAATADWTQWGGPNRNFNVPDAGLAAKWPSGGPTKLWSRPLGEGYAAIAEHDGRLFTMYRRDGGHESIIALDAATGKTIWEHQFDAVPHGMDLQYGKGPHVMPQIVDGRVFAIGITQLMFALDEKTGKVIWSHDLGADFGGENMGRGYGNNPLPYKDMLLLPIGGRANPIIALSQRTGKLIWRSSEILVNAYASPNLINVGGQDQAVFFVSNEIYGLNPDNGKTLWKHAHKTDWGLNISTPVWGGGNMLFLSSAYSGGSRVLQLTRQGDQTTVKELWYSNRMKIHITNAIRRGPYIFASSGDLGPSFFSAVDVNTGQELWRSRDLARVNMIQAGDKTIMLDEDGKLVLAKPDDKGMNIISKVEVMKANCWTPPTLAGTKLYMRDRKTIVTLDLK